MKSWLAKFRISAALDEGRRLPKGLAKAAANSEELRRFDESAVKLDAALRIARPQVELPPLLHEAILGAVEAAERPASAEPRGTWLRWVPVPALALLVVFGVWWGMRHRQPQPSAAETQSLVWVSTVMDVSDQMRGALPGAVVSPLSEELAYLDEDVGRTAEFLLASLP
jgi:hypothetical protein